MAAAALLLVIGIIGAFTVDSGDSKLTASSATTTTVAGETTTSDVATTEPAATATTVTGGTTKTTKAGGSTATTAASATVGDPGVTKPPAAGTYVYKFTSTADSSSNGDTEAKVEALPDQNGAARRRQTYKDGSGNTLSNDESWGGDAMKVLSSHIVSPQATVDCTWQPPILVFQLPLAVGKSWNFDSTCTTSFSGTQVTIRRNGTAKVTGKANDKVGDVTVATWVIESSGNTSVKSAFFNTETAEKTTRHFASGKGLVTYEKGTATTAGSTAEYERTLKSLSPK
jgi:hypothetical protein